MTNFVEGNNLHQDYVQKGVAKSVDLCRRRSLANGVEFPKPDALDRFVRCVGVSVGR